MKPGRSLNYRKASTGLKPGRSYETRIETVSNPVRHKCLSGANGVKKKIKWLTQEYIIAEAKASPKRALNVSIKHYWQIAGVSYEEYHQAVRDGLTGDHCGFCGLCRRYFYSTVCIKCPVKLKTGERVCQGFKEWKEFSANKIPSAHKELAGKVAVALIKLRKVQK